MSTFKKSSLSDQIVRHLRREIVGGSYKAGQRLREEELASSFRVSRHVVRQALVIIEEEGLIEAASHGKIVSRFENEDIEFLLPVRVLVECCAVEKATPRLTETETRTLRHLAHRLKGTVLDKAEYVDLEISFHETIWNGCGNPRLRKLCRHITFPFFALQFAEMDRQRDWPGEMQRQESGENPEGHQLLAEAICQRDVARAVELMRKHVSWGEVNPAHLRLLFDLGEFQAQAARDT